GTDGESGEPRFTSRTPFITKPREASGVRRIPALSSGQRRASTNSAGMRRTPNASRGLNAIELGYALIALVKACGDFRLAPTRAATLQPERIESLSETPSR